MEVLTCGICGYINKEKILSDTIIFNMTSALTCASKSVITHTQGNVSFGQKYENPDNVTPIFRKIAGKNYIVIFNGRIYNLDEVKEDLISKGYNFIYNDDLEVILLAYICYSEQSVKLFDGSFSYAIWDENKLLLARDRLGVKPLFYSSDDLFIFSSEIKSILKHPDIKAKIGKEEICEIFGLGPAHSPGKTFFKGIYEILPGHYGVYHNNEFKTYKYWDLETTEITDTIDESIVKVKELVKNSLKRQLEANAPVCSMLSGGLDSSVLCTLASKEINNISTFSIDFENNELNFAGTDYQPTRDSDYVKIMTDFIKSNHTNLYFSTEEIFNNLRASMIARDMPGMADVDSSMLVFCKKIKACGYSVALSGECSDEIFGGYPWYYKAHLINSENFPWSRSITTRKNIINSKLLEPEYLENYINKAYASTSNNVVYNSSDHNENIFRKTCYNTIKWFMCALIERTERMSKSAGLEVRIPFADYRIFEYVYNLSCKYKLGLIDGNDSPVEKYLLRKAFEDILPYDVVYRKKSPFPKTYDPEYTKLLEQSIKEVINKSSSPILELINIRYLYEILESHGENLKENWFGQLMAYPQTLAYLLQINMWLEEYNVEIEV